MRNRVFAGESVLTVWFSIENALITPETDPYWFVPSTQDQLQWPKWGQYFETRGKAGEKIDMPEAAELVKLRNDWRRDPDPASRARVWRRILDINADQVLTLGIVGGALQPVVVSNKLRNVPDQAIFNWDPGANIGMYDRPSFWFADKAQTASAK
jgi:peptide/nickel transport system substrate-binding protein